MQKKMRKLSSYNKIFKYSSPFSPSFALKWLYKKNSEMRKALLETLILKSQIKKFLYENKLVYFWLEILGFWKHQM